jgi:hypothetical protein
VARDEPQVSVGGLLEQEFLGVSAVSKEHGPKGTMHAPEKKEDQCMTKGKGSSARQDLRKSDAYVDKPSHVRVRVLESYCKGFNPFCSINKMYEVD